MTDNPIHIALYHPRSLLGDGGITQSVRALAEGLEAIGYRVTVIYNKGRRGSDKPNWRPVAHSGIGVLMVPKGLRAALEGVDVVVLHSAWVMHNVLAARTAARLGIPYVLAPRGAYDPLIMGRRRRLKKMWWWLFEGSLVARAAGVHVFFDSQRAHLRSLGYDGAFVVAPNGVRVPDGRTWHGDNSRRLAYVGRFDPEHKGLDLLLEGIALIPEASRPKMILRGTDWRGGKIRLQSLVTRLGLESWVEIGPGIHGEDKWEFICSSAGFVYPSRWEAFGNSPAEAAALGVPTLVTEYPLGTYLHSNAAAVMADRSPRGLATGLISLLAPEAREIGNNGLKLMTDFTWDAVSRSWGSQLETVVQSSDKAEHPPQE